MKKIRNILICSAFLIAFLILGACSMTTYAEQENPLKIWFHNQNGNYQTLCVVDDDTGVNYVVVATELGGGHRSISVTPRLNADGTLYVSK